MRFVIVEAWNVGELFAAGFLKTLFDLFVDLFKRFDAIRGKCWRAHGNLFLTSFGQSRDFLNGIRLQPFCGTKARLERRGNFRVFPAQTFFQQSSRFLAMAMIGIAL